MSAVQYDLFKEYDEFFEIKELLESQKDSLRRTQKKFFAQNKELMCIIVRQQDQIDQLNNRITLLTKLTA